MANIPNFSLEKSIKKKISFSTKPCVDSINGLENRNRVFFNILGKKIEEKRNIIDNFRKEILA